MDVLPTAAPHRMQNAAIFPMRSHDYGPCTSKNNNLATKIICRFDHLSARMKSSRSSSPWMRPDDRRQEGVTHTWSRVALPIKIMCPLRVVVKNEPWFECVLY